MSKLFYDHLININQLKTHLRELKLQHHELRELETQLDELIQHRVVEIILDILHQDHHHIFITRLEKTPHDPQLLEWLKQYVHDIEQHIATEISKLETELINELSNESNQTE